MFCVSISTVSLTQSDGLSVHSCLEFFAQYIYRTAMVAWTRLSFTIACLDLVTVTPGSGASSGKLDSPSGMSM